MDSNYFIIIASLICLFITNLSMAQVGVLGELTHEKIVQIGETYKGIIIIANPDEKTQRAKIYQTDYLFFSDGGHIYGDPGKDPRSNANWITFGPSQPIIPPKGTSEISYTIKVPDDKNLAGTYWSLIMVEGIPDTSPDIIQSAKGEARIGMQTLIRYGVQIITHIGDTGKRELDFVSTKLLKSEENNILQLDIKNVGERLLRPLVWVELYDKNGNNVGKFDGGKLRVYPGTSVRYKINLIDLHHIFNTEKVLFSSIQQDIQKGTIPDILLQEFRNNGISLPQNTNVSVQNKSNGWQISYEDKRFVITKEENGLKVQEQYKIPTGIYKALIIADCGGDDFFGANYNLEIKD
ncbi:hypothetical protein FJZ33_11095 [Candidatus Poribacteria bacterium]|nr:hypothetical protein [Candidatus Poribacteria bacterium]